MPLSRPDDSAGPAVAGFVPLKSRISNISVVEAAMSFVTPTETTNQPGGLDVRRRSKGLAKERANKVDRALLGYTQRVRVRNDELVLLVLGLVA